MVELLSPAGDFETLQAAIKAGANAVYFGIKGINMRSGSARNFNKEDLKEIMEILHKNKVRGYLTLNTLIYDHELERVQDILKEVKKSKVDAVIATDMAIVQLCNENNIEVHMSTQLSTSNYEAVKFFSKFSPRMVLARECTLEQIKSIKYKIEKDNLNYNGRKIELETFIHGALCVSYSGRCFMSQFQNRLSANRGQCLQECRRQYKLIDLENSERELVLDGNYILSPKDLCTLPILDKLVEAKIDVFKIEGRAKGADYIYTVTKSYREALDLIKKNKFTNKEKLRLLEELEKVFNRGFTTNFFLGTPTNDSWTKFYGSISKEKKKQIGKVIEYFPKLKVVAVKIEQEELNEGDTICFIGKSIGCYKTKVKNMRLEDKEVKKVKKGDEVSFKVEEKLKPSDQVYLIKKVILTEEEEELYKKFEEITIHKPFKQTKRI
jgi:U32 family peptidase